LCRTVPPVSSPRVSFSAPPAPTDIYPLSLHDALPIWIGILAPRLARRQSRGRARSLHPRLDARSARLSVAARRRGWRRSGGGGRSEEHTSELQSRENLVCRLLLEKKKQQNTQARTSER